MATAQFSDDAYNKKLIGDGAGTLIANWFEERSIRDSTGEGRTVPQRHIPRSGLLQDFAKMPSTGPRKGDNTFERIYGGKMQHDPVPSSKTIGNFREEAQDKVGPKEKTLHELRLQAAEAEVLEEEAERAELENQRFFETTTGVTFSKPDESQAEKAQHSRKNFHGEIMHGKPADVKIALANEGMEVMTNAHYSNVEAITHQRMSLVDPRMRNDLRVSAAAGVSAFGKHSEFSKPVSEFNKGLAKDEELEVMYKGLQGTQPHRNLGGSQPRGAFAAVPSLATLKEAIHNRLIEAFGAQGYVKLRQLLFDGADQQGLVSSSYVVGMLREQVGLGEEVDDAALNIYLTQMCTMSKGDLRIGALFTSLRPVMLQKDKRRVLEAFKTLLSANTDGQLPFVADWLDKCPMLAAGGDAELRSTIVAAFGGQDAEAPPVEMTEQMFVEVLSDLAPFMDISPLLEIQ